MNKTKSWSIRAGSDVNMTPPPYAECPECNGAAIAIKPMSNLFQGHAAVYHKCPGCAGTGLTPIPLPEVMGGLRRG